MLLNPGPQQVRILPYMIGLCLKNGQAHLSCLAGMLGLDRFLSLSSRPDSSSLCDSSPLDLSFLCLFLLLGGGGGGQSAVPAPSWREVICVVCFPDVPQQLCGTLETIRTICS